MTRKTQRKVMLIGQAPPQREATIPYGRTRLYAWLGRIGITRATAQEMFTFAALVDEFPGKNRGQDRKPSTTEMGAYRPKLLALIAKTGPSIIVPIGALAIGEVLRLETVSLNETVGRSFYAAPFGVGTKKLRIIPLPHPSGLSSWIYLGSNSELLDLALSSLAAEISAFATTQRAESDLE